MTTVNAKLRFARIAPRKARLVARVIRGLPVAEAEARLSVLSPRAAPMLLKLLRSAVANARHNAALDPKHLVVAHALVNEGPRLKRFFPRARGSADRILKRTSHMEIILADTKAGEIPVGREQAAKKKTVIETKKAEELTEGDLKENRELVKGKPGERSETRAVKPLEPARGIRRLLERKHGAAE